jgi:hypothetical protein
MEFITFLLAPIGYAGLTFTAVMAARGRLPRRFWRAVVLVIVTHVTLVWTVRYEWQLSEATRNGYVGFLVFHGALAAILSSLISGDRVARVLIIGAFAVVTVGAIAATFRYDVVGMYRIPVLVCAIAGAAGLTGAYRSRAALAA